MQGEQGQMRDLNGFIERGIKDIAATAGRFYLGDLKGQGFMMRMAAALQKSTKTRAKFERSGTHIPPFSELSLRAHFP